MRIIKGLAVPEPTSTSVITYFSIAKIWSITAGVCGSIIPILALADQRRITLISAFFMALTGSSFSIFVGPWVAQKMDIVSIEGIVALSWIMGAGGVYLVRAVLKWLDKRGVDAIDNVVNKALGTTPKTPIKDESGDENAE
jgi:hypothetical protein